MVVTRQKAISVVQSDPTGTLQDCSSDSRNFSGPANNSTINQHVALLSDHEELASKQHVPITVFNDGAVVSASINFATSHEAQARASAPAASAMAAFILAESPSEETVNTNLLKSTTNLQSALSGNSGPSCGDHLINTTQSVQKPEIFYDDGVQPAHCTQLNPMANKEAIKSTGGIMSKFDTENCFTTSKTDGIDLGKNSSSSSWNNQFIISITDQPSHQSRAGIHNFCHTESCLAQPFTSSVEFSSTLASTQAVTNIASGYVVSSVTPANTGAGVPCTQHISSVPSELKSVPSEQDLAGTTCIVSITEPNRISDLKALADRGSKELSEDASLVHGVPSGVHEEEDLPVQLTWTRTATLKLLELYKEHEVYLRDPHYKKKSVWERIAARMNMDPSDPIQYHWNQVENKWKNMTKKYRDCINSNRRNGTNHKCPFFDQLATIYNYCPDEAHKTAVEGLRALGYSFKAPVASKDLPGVDLLAASANSLKRDHGAIVDLSDDKKDERKSIPLPKKKKKYERQSSAKLPTSLKQQMHVETLVPAQQAPLTRILSSANSDAASSTSSAQSSSDPMTLNYESIIATIKQLSEDRKAQNAQRMERLEQMHQEKINLFRQFLDILKQAD